MLRCRCTTVVSSQAVRHATEPKPMKLSQAQKNIKYLKMSASMFVVGFAINTFAIKTQLAEHAANKKMERRLALDEKVLEAREEYEWAITQQQQQLKLQAAHVQQTQPPSDVRTGEKR